MTNQAPTSRPNNSRRGRTVIVDGPDPIDVQVGRRLREARIMASLSQEELGTAIGVSFQAIQKYETGENRLSASRLMRAARMLARSPAFFFEGIEDDAPLVAAAADFSAGELELVRHYRRVSDDVVRAQMLEIVKKIEVTS